MVRGAQVLYVEHVWRGAVPQTWLLAVSILPDYVGRGLYHPTGHLTTINDATIRRCLHSFVTST